MEFWGVEVKAGQPLKVKPTFDNIIHLSQASLGESKKDKCESVCLYVKFGDQKFVAGTLLSDTIPQLSFDLVFEKEFELSHNWKNGSVFFLGYQTPLSQDDSDEFDMEDSEEDEEELPTIPAENGKAAPKAEKAKAPAAKAVAAKPGKDVKPEEDDDSESDDEDDSDDDMLEDDSDEIAGEDEGSDEDEDDSDEEDEETPKKAQAGKKRPAESATKTPISAKKGKPVTPDGKKGVHVATPHPAKAGKTPSDKAQTPKSGGQISCKSCSKSFGSDGALQSHTKAKHSGK